MKKKKLENPNFSVSRVRLSVMNLPIDCAEGALKKAFLAAARTARKLEKGTGLIYYCYPFFVCKVVPAFSIGLDASLLSSMKYQFDNGTGIPRRL